MSLPTRLAWTTIDSGGKSQEVMLGKTGPNTYGVWIDDVLVLMHKDTSVTACE